MKFKIIDGKGKLFGWINIIDFTIIVFILLLAPAFYYGGKIFHQSPIQPISSSQEKLLSEENQKLKAQISNFLKEHKRAKKYFPDAK